MHDITLPCTGREGVGRPGSGDPLMDPASSSSTTARCAYGRMLQGHWRLERDYAYGTYELYY